MAVVGTEHHHVGTLADQVFQQFVVLGGTALTDDHLHAGTDARATLLERRTLVVGGDAGTGILVALVSGQSGGMAVNGLPMPERRLDLCHHLLVACQHSRVVHHLTQEPDVRTCHQLLGVLRIQHGAAGLYLATNGRHAAGRTETEVESHLTAGAYHEVDSLDAQHVADLVRVGNHADGAVSNDQAPELARRHHAALNMYVTVDEARHQIRPRGLALRQFATFHFDDRLAVNHQFAIEYLVADHVNNMSLYTHHSFTFWLQTYIKFLDYTTVLIKK